MEIPTWEDTATPTLDHTDLAFRMQAMASRTTVGVQVTVPAVASAWVGVLASAGVGVLASAGVVDSAEE